MTKLSDAGERASDTLVNALMINGLPEQNENFVVQGSFQPVTTFEGLRTRLRNFEDAIRVRQEEQPIGNQVTMHGLRKGNSLDAKRAVLDTSLRRRMVLITLRAKDAKRRDTIVLLFIVGFFDDGGGIHNLLKSG